MADSLATKACKQFIKDTENQNQEENLDDIKINCKKISKKKVKNTLNV